jgi:hypothetical protein
MPTRTPETHDALVHRWRTALARTSARTISLTEGLSDAQLRQRPADGGWSINQVFEHLVLTGEVYLVGINAAIAAAKPTACPPIWKPTWVGWLLATAVSPQASRKLSAPKRMQPGSVTRPNVVAAYSAETVRIASLLGRATALDLNRVRIASPILRIIRLNLGDCFEVNIQHGTRHLDQVARVRTEIVG